MNPTAPTISYCYALLRVVPHVHVGAFVNVGVVVHARTAEYLGLRVLTDPDTLRRLVPDADIELLVRYLRALERIGAGDAAAGPVALTSGSERFHWLTAPRSDVVQTSPVHEGVCVEPGTVLDELFAAFIAPGPLPQPS